MKLSDFKKGQTVYIKESLWRKESKIYEAQVSAVGRKYVTVKMNGWKEVKFDSTANFKESTIYTPTLFLYLHKEDIEKEKERKKKGKRKKKNWNKRFLGIFL